ncbi:MAG: ATP-dependent Clp protease adaptor ClpS [Bacteroidetes bacterium]|nr:ATP-dependent Clp protease adaptor ClpS [Bacteroidota bacterium]
MVMLTGVFGQTTENQPLEIEETATDSQTPARVILFNDDWHTFEEVIGQLIKALGCDTDKAGAIALEAHTKGKALVFEGPMKDCLQINGVLEEISLITQIEI